MKFSIDDTVGYRAANNHEDVKTIHNLLKIIPPASGGPPLSFNPKSPYKPSVTDVHIYNFQVKHFGKGPNADAVVTPRKDTLAKMIETANAAIAAQFVGNAIQKRAAAAGQLVYALNQSSTDALSGVPGPWGSVQMGFCAGLAIRWIGLRATGRDYPFDATTLYASASGQFWEAIRDQNILIDVEAPGNEFLARLETVLRRYGVTVNRTKYEKSRQRVSAAMLDRVLFAGDGLYYLELRRKGGGHSISLERNKTTYRLFDGNTGHFCIEGLKPFKEFADRFLNETGYQGRYTEGTWILGANYSKRS